MGKLIENCIRYIYTVLGVKVDIREFKEPDNFHLPYILRENYSFYDIIIDQKEYLLIHPKDEKEITPAVYKKQIYMLQQSSNKEIILLLWGINSFNRRRLIDHKIQFIVPGKQLYIPSLGIDLRERFSNAYSKRRELRPAAQSILLYLLNNNDHGKYDVDKLNHITNYSKSSIRRAFLEFEDISIGKIEKVGKNKYFYLDEEVISIWTTAIKYCRNPIVTQLFISDKPMDFEFKIAGLTALSEYTMIAPAKNPVYAIYKEEWFKLQKDESVKKLIEPIQTESNIKLQVWSYPPGLWGNGNLVDKYSLYLSLKDETDERVEQALEEMLEEEMNGKRN
jgi:hypothetical protein